MGERNWIGTMVERGLLLAVLLCGGVARGSEGDEGGLVLEGMHPVGQEWVGAHGDYAEGGTDICRSCHGADLHGTALSRTSAERVLNADDYGRKIFWAGFQVGCWACHAGPNSERPSPNRPAQVADASLTVAAGEPGRVVVVATDPDGDALELRIVAPPGHGTARIDGADLVYVPDGGFAGEDELRIAAWDGFVDSNLASVFVSVVASDAGGELCTGDCDGDGRIAVGELVTAVRMALHVAVSGTCSSADANGDGEVAVGELVLAVRDSLQGCGDGPAATPTPTPTGVPATPTRAAASSPTLTRSAVTPTATRPAAATPTSAAPSLAALQAEIFTSSCATSFCHDAQGRAGGLNLTAGAAYAQLVGVAPDNAAARAAGLERVAPGMPDASFLLIKLTTPGPGQGFSMPPGAPLSAAQIERVRAWIAAGAQP